MTLSSTELMSLAESTARAAAPIALEGFRTAMTIDLKANIHDVVTVYDRATEDRIRELLLAAHPESVIVGEEYGTHGTGEVTWYVDPIDGTSNFARGIAFWCISIAAAVNGTVVAGVIYDPIEDNMFHADETGAYLNNDTITASGYAEQAGGTLLAHFPMPGDFAINEQLALKEYAMIVNTFSAVRNIGSGALCLAHVAAGWSDGTFNFDTNSWDVAAGSFILKQAGGRYDTFLDGTLAPEHGDFLRPHYFGYVAEAKYPMITAVMEQGSARRAASAIPNS